MAAYRHYATAGDIKKLPCQVDVMVDMTVSHPAAHMDSVPLARGPLPEGPSAALTDLITGASWEPAAHAVKAKEKRYAAVLNAAARPRGRPS